MVTKYSETSVDMATPKVNQTTHVPNINSRDATRKLKNLTKMKRKYHKL